MIAAHPFDKYVAQPEDAIRVAEAALLFGRDHAPSIKPLEYLRELERLAVLVDRENARTPADEIEALAIVLADREGFRGNASDYYDPRNSLLHDVLDRRCGIPITLSVVWLDVAEQLGWPFVGVGLPGHYMVKRLADKKSPELYLDPFSGGRQLDRAECDALISGILGSMVTLTDENFAPASPQATLTRMLNNLRLIYMRREEWRHLADVILRLRALHPRSPDFAHESTMIAERLSELN
ncbi:MAG: hypothetical protein PWP23_861 [Candidatus Sumerlaeota bacterium]|nr:hypothetical protein [Candidatus Sumerlaeota bacterium]